jgi:hypothetical protein
LSFEIYHSKNNVHNQDGNHDDNKVRITILFLSSIINNCLSTKSISSFENLLLFSYRAFNVAEISDKSLNKHIKENLSNFEVPQLRTGSKKRTNLSLTKKVEAKVADFDIRGAVKLLSSDDSLASFNEDVAEEL